MSRTPRLVLGSAVALALFASLIGLGVWQLQRLALKSEFRRQQEFVYNAPPIELPVRESNLAGMAYRRVRVTGTFDHAHEFHLWAQRDGKAGYDVLTPIVRVGEGEGQTLLVDRGWVPLDRKDPGTRVAAQAPGTVTIAGFVRTDMAIRGAMTPANDPAQNIWYAVDYAAMGDKSQMYLRPYVLVADAAPNPGGLPLGVKGLPAEPNNHLQYAITWFSIAAALVAIYVLALRRQLAAAKTSL